jgi:hypothetical protein
VSPPRLDGRTVFVRDKSGALIGVLLTQGTGVHATPSGQARSVFFASWLAALGWLKARGIKA